MFREKLKHAVLMSDTYRDDIWKLSLDAGLGKKTVYNILRDEALDASRAGPGIFGMAQVASLLGVSLDWLVGKSSIGPVSSGQEPELAPLAGHVVGALQAQSGAGEEGLSVDALLRVHTKSGGRIEAFDRWRSRCDEYHVPGKTDDGIRVKSVGSQSLSAITMGSASAELLQSALDSVDSVELKTAWIRDYRSASESGSLTTVESLDVQMPNRPVRVKMDFLRCLLSVDDADGNSAILNFCLLIV